MRAARLHGLRDIKIDEIPEPECPAGYVKIAPRFNGLCGSDIHMYQEEAMVAQLVGPHALTGEAMPATMGHELAGEVTEIGAGVQHFKAGDRVTVQPIISDGTCRACLGGAINCCKQIGFRGVHGGGGGLADRIVVPETAVFKLPDSIPLDVGALIEPLAVAWHGVRVAGRLSPSMTALVQGGGPIGAAVVLCLASNGLRSILVAEPLAARARLIRDLGATRVIDPAHEDVAAVVAAATHGNGADVVFDCAGVPATMASSVQALASLGTLVNLAIWWQPAPLNATRFAFKEATYRGSLAYTPLDFEEVIQAVANGSIEPAQMITKRISLEDVVAEGIETLQDRANAHCKILVDLSL